MTSTLNRSVTASAVTVVALLGLTGCLVSPPSTRDITVAPTSSTPAPTQTMYPSPSVPPETTPSASSGTDADFEAAVTEACASLFNEWFGLVPDGEELFFEEGSDLSFALQGETVACNVTFRALDYYPDFGPLAEPETLGIAVVVNPTDIGFEQMALWAEDEGMFSAQDYVELFPNVQTLAAWEGRLPSMESFGATPDLDSEVDRTADWIYRHQLVNSALPEDMDSQVLEDFTRVTGTVIFPDSEIFMYARGWVLPENY